MTARYFTSDLHFGHHLVSELRGFTNPDEHDQHIADVWRDTIRPTDAVWVLGDLCVSRPDRALDLLASLPGTKHLILGNHDAAHPMHRRSARAQADLFGVFASVATAGRLRLPHAGDVLLSHFPYATDDGEADHGPTRYAQWRLPDLGTPLLHGHTHKADQVLHGHQVHVGWDAWDKPVHEATIGNLLSEAESR